MIPNLAIIISAYALARLLNSYVFPEPELRGLRIVLALVACLAIVVALIGILGAASSLDL